MTVNFYHHRYIALPFLACLVLFLFYWQYTIAQRRNPLFRYATQPHSGPSSSTWLAATSQPASAIGRRMIIRLTWQRFYKDVPVTTRFILANPGPLWAPLVKAENATYGDIIVLEHLQESKAVATSVKPLELFKWLTMQNQRYLFVSKLDDDSFLNARGFYNSYLAPRMEILPGSKEQKASVNYTVIGRRLRRWKFDYPGGQFYTVTWDLLEALVKAQERLNITNMEEDVLVGHLLREANQTWTLVDLLNPVAFDYAEKYAEQGSACPANAKKQEEWVHAVGPNAINPHQLKDDNTYMQVANCFDERGTKSFN